MDITGIVRGNETNEKKVEVVSLAESVYVFDWVPAEGKRMN